MPFGRLVVAFNMPFVGGGVFNQLHPEAALPVRILVLSGIVTASFTGLAFILGAIEQNYHEEMSDQHLSYAKPPKVSQEAVFVTSLVLLAAIGGAGWVLGTSFLVACMFLAVLHAAFTLLFHSHRLAGSLAAAGIGALQCLLPFFQGRFGDIPLPVVAVALGFGTLIYCVSFVLLYYRPRIPGPVDPRRLREGWYPFAMSAFLAASLLAVLACCGASFWGVFLAVLVLAWGVWNGHCIAKRLTRWGIRSPERARMAALFFGLPLASLQAALLFGRKDTAMAGGGLLLVVIGVNWLCCRGVTPCLPNRISEANLRPPAPDGDFQHSYT